MSWIEKARNAFRGQKKDAISIKEITVTEPIDEEPSVESKLSASQSTSHKLEMTPVSIRRQRISDWKNAIEAATNPSSPSFHSLDELYKSLLLDNHLVGVMESRVYKILQSKFKIVNKKTGEENEDLKILFQQSWFKQYLKLSIMSVFTGCSVIELFELDADGHLKEINQIPKSHVNPYKGLILKRIGDTKGWDYKNSRLKNYYIQISKSDNLGVLADLAPILLVKKLATGSWADFVEKYGIPPRYVTTDNLTKARQQDLANMLKNMISAHYAVLQGNETLQTLNTNTSDVHEVFDKLIERCNSEITKRILGSTGTVDEKAFVGSTLVHQEVANFRHEADKERERDLVNKELIPRLKKISTIYAPLENHTFIWDDSSEMSRTEYIESVVKIAPYFEIDAAAFQERTGLPILFKKGQITTQKKKNSVTSGILAEMYGEAAHGHNYNILATTTNLLKFFEELILKVFKGSAFTVATDLHFGISEHLIETIELPIAESGAIGLKDTGFYANLQSNLFQFGAAKSFTEQFELSNLLTDENGNLRKFADFKKEALKLHPTYNVTWLNTEYNTAQSTAQMASQWRDIELEKDLYDLEFITAGDEDVRAEHALYDGIVRPVDDDFWNKHLPPLDWECRCDKLQVGKGNNPITSDEDIAKLPKVKEQFAFNAGKEEIIFNDKHPYMQNLNTKTIRKLKGVGDYGLMDANSIYDKKNLTNNDLDNFSQKSEASDWWNGLKGDNDSFIQNTKLNSTTDFEVNINDDAINKVLNANGQKWKFANHITDTMKNPTEVYSDQKGNYALIKYYNSRVIKVDIKNVDGELNFKNVTEYTQQNIDSERKGLLMFAKRR